MGVIVGLAVLLILAAGVQRRPWGVGFALALQVATVACGLLVPALGVLGLVFGAVWAFLLYLRRDVARRRAAGQPPGQQVHEPYVRRAVTDRRSCCTVRPWPPHLAARCCAARSS